MTAVLITGASKGIGKATSKAFAKAGWDLLLVGRNKNDLENLTKIINSNGTILCDDYNLSYAPGVKKAIDEFSHHNNLKCTIICNNRFAKIEKN